MGELHPEILINLSRIPALRYLIEEKGFRLGALTSFRDLEKSRVIKEKYTALFEAARSVSSVQIKTMGTVGGNLCHGSPAADSAPPLIVFGGKVKLVENGSERILPVEDFFVGPGQTVLSPKEILVEIQIPESAVRMGSAFLKMGRVAADLSKVSVAVAMVREGDVCKDCRIALGAVAKTPLRAKKGEEILKGKKVTEALIEKTGEQVSRGNPAYHRPTFYSLVSQGSRKSHDQRCHPYCVGKSHSLMRNADCEMRIMKSEIPNVNVSTGLRRELSRTL